MFNVLTKSLVVIGFCGSLAFFSTKYVNFDNKGTIYKTSHNNQKSTVKEIKRLEDIDVWGKENGCNFIFVKNWKKGEIYTAIGFAEAKGGRKKKLDNWNLERNWEETILKTVNEYKTFCGNKLKSFTFLWSGIDNKFYIGNPEEKLNTKRTFFNF